MPLYIRTGAWVFSFLFFSIYSINFLYTIACSILYYKILDYCPTLEVYSNIIDSPYFINLATVYLDAKPYFDLRS